MLYLKPLLVSPCCMPAPQQDLKAENVLLTVPSHQPLPFHDETTSHLDHEDPWNPNAEDPLAKGILAQLEGEAALVQIMLVDFDLCRFKPAAQLEGGGPEGAARAAAQERVAQIAAAAAAQEKEAQSAGAAPYDTEGPIIWGTVDYIAPELIQGNGDGYSEVSDWWWVWERVDRELQST